MSRYIETSEATAVIADYFDVICDTEYRFNESDILRRLNNSAVDAVPVRHGKWVDDAIGVLRCSECNTQAPWKYGRDFIDYRWESNYCPNCGARMDKE